MSEKVLSINGVIPTVNGKAIIAEGGGGGINLVKTVDVLPQFDPGSTFKTTVVITDVPETATVFFTMKESDIGLFAPDGSHKNEWMLESGFYHIENGSIVGVGTTRNAGADTWGKVAGGQYGASIVRGCTYENGVLTLTTDLSLAYQFSATAHYRFYVYDAIIHQRYL